MTGCKDKKIFFGAGRGKGQWNISELGYPVLEGFYAGIQLNN